MPDCPTCGRSFDTENGMKVHHAKIHGESISGVEAECDCCGDTIRVERYRTEQNHIFCGDECMGKWRSENYVGEDHHSYNRVTVECDNCGETVETHPHRLEISEHHFCDSSCYAEWSTGRPRPENENNVAVNCDWCGDNFKKPKSQYEKTTYHFCDFDCYRGWHGENMVGAASPRWRGGYPYSRGPEWGKTRDAIRERDGHKCQSCGMDETEHQERFGEELNVHHIRPRVEFINDDGSVDWDGANAEDNLVTLCRSCHKEWEGLPVRPDIAD